MSFKPVPNTNKGEVGKVSHGVQEAVPVDIQASKDSMKGSDITSLKQGRKQSKRKDPTYCYSRHPETQIYDLTTDHCFESTAPPPKKINSPRSGVPESMNGGVLMPLKRAPNTNKRVVGMVSHGVQKAVFLDIQASKDSMKCSHITSLKHGQKQSKSKDPKYCYSRPPETQIFDLTTDDQCFESTAPPPENIYSARSRVPESIRGGGGGDQISLYRAPASLDFQALKESMECSEIASLKQRETPSRRKGPVCCNSWCSLEAEIIPSQNIRDFFGIPKGKAYRICRQCRDLYTISSEAREMNFEKGGDMLEMMYSHLNEFVGHEGESTSDDDENASDDDTLSGREELLRNAVAESVLEFDSLTSNAINRSKEQLRSILKNFVRSGTLLMNQMLDIKLEMYKNICAFQNEFKGKLIVLPELNIPLPEGDEMSGSTAESVDQHCSQLTLTAKAPTASDRVYCIPTPQTLEWCEFKVESVEVNCVGDNQIVDTFTLVTTFDEAVVRKVARRDEIAFFDPPCFPMGVGRRVIAAYRSGADSPKRFLSGMISEFPSDTNQFRYLVFFEEGLVQYCSRLDIRLIYKINKPVYEYFIGVQSTFVMEYLCNYPMIKKCFVEVGQQIRVEKNGFWVLGQVEKVDASLLLLKYLFNNESEWLFRGSPRLRHVFDSTKRSKVQDVIKSQSSPLKKLSLSKTIQSVGDELIDITNDDDEEDLVDIPPLPHEFGLLTQEQTFFALKNHRTRSAGKNDWNVLTKIPPMLLPLPFREHRCSFACVNWVRYDLNNFKGVGPLAIPSIVGFSRKIESNEVKYLSPCGVNLSNIEHVLQYLALTCIPLTIDMFTFSPFINIFDEWMTHHQYIVMDDISLGIENLPIPCVNDVDSEVPCLMSYITERRHDGIFIDQDPGFLISCDCEDNCTNRSVCSCWQLNYESFSLLRMEGIPLSEIGYKYQRLEKVVPSGIYECNRNCKCSATCINRLVQHPLKNKLQLFKTPKTGWGIRCLNDIPSGTFVCTYVATIYTEEASNEIGWAGGDDYFAELDHIETMEEAKIGYESDAEGPSKRKKTKASSVSKKTLIPNTYKVGSLRKLYGPNENPYVLDSKQAGNIGRFFNHSCSPNMFVQSVFVDSHDPRFPWVALFTSKDIPAGSELTWDYGYSIGSVPGKVLFCQCDSPACVKRLL